MRITRLPNSRLEIDLQGLEDKWGSRNVCAVCGRDFDGDEEPTDEDGLRQDGTEPPFPLQLFKGRGRSVKMLVLCSHPCAEARMQNRKGN